MPSTRVHTRIIQHPYAYLVQGARLDSVYENEKDLFLYLHGLQITISELLEQDGRIFERVTGSYIPLRLHFSGVYGVYCDDFVLNLQAGYSYYQRRKITFLNDLVNLEKTIAADPELHDTTTFQMVSARGFVSNIPGKNFEYQTGVDMNYENAHGKRTGGYRA